MNDNPLLDTTDLPRFDDIRPSHAVSAVKELIAAHRQMLAALLDSDTARDVDSFIVPLEDMSHELSRVWSPISHLQSVLDDPAWRDAYNAVLPIMTEHGTELSQNTALFAAFEEVSAALPDNAAPSVRQLVDHELRDFRLSGVALTHDKKERYRSLVQDLASLQASFEQNVQDATDAWHYHVQTDVEVSGIPDSALTRAKTLASEQGVDGWWFVLDYPNYHAVMTHADNRDLRYEFYRAWSTRASDQSADPKHGKNWNNSQIIDKILAKRHELAQLVGFANFAEYSLATKMANGNDEVTVFLHELASRARHAAEREFAEIQALAGSELGGEKLQAWDVTYYLEKLKQRTFSISDDELRQYFPADKVLQGMFAVAERLYSVSVTARDNVSRWHDTVRFFEIRDNSGALVGGFYTDLYARAGKRGGAWMDECVVRKHLSSDAIAPIGYLVCNFPPPDAKGASLLTHNDVVTLFHEFGHMLHHLLTRIDFPSVAGINGVPWDAVELPSQFMENYAWQYEVLKDCSAHVDSGRPLPNDLFEKLKASRNFGEGLATVRQVELALFDFSLHAKDQPAAGREVLDVLAEVRQTVAVVEHPAFNRLPNSFSHIFAGGYSAGYYSYKWAEVLAADAFSAFEEAGIFDAATAGRFRQEILEVGGSRDFMDAYVAFRGRKPSIDALLKQSGIDNAA